MTTTLKTMPSVERRATLADVWPLITPLLMGQAPPEGPLPKLERCNASIRPLNPHAWPKGSLDETAPD